MPGISDEKHMVEAGLALCAALRTVGRDPDATNKAIDEAEAHYNAVRTTGSSKPKAEKPEKPEKPIEAKKAKGVNNGPA